MQFDDGKLFEAASRYCKSKGMHVLRQERLGHGSDGSVWKTSIPSAVKALYRHETYKTELECYRRLQENGIDKINGLNVPVLEGYSDELRVIEITFVRPPFFLDFGKVRLDRPPSDFYDKQKIANAHSEWRNNFGERWKDVSVALYELKRRCSIYYLDPRPGNINFGDEDDGDDWLSEPELDYTEYD